MNCQTARDSSASPAALNRAQRLECIGALAGGIAHDLNNALMPIFAVAGMFRAQRHVDDEELEILEQSAKRCADMVRQLLTFAKGAEGEQTTLHLKGIMREIQKLVAASFPKNIELLMREEANTPPIKGNPTQLHQVLMNLCVNARDAMPEGGRLTIELECKDANTIHDSLFGQNRAERYLLLKVSDNGTGISPEVQKKIFDPFFTTKSPDKGTGLGLASARSIIRGHGGEIACYSRLGQGTTFTIYLPTTTNTMELFHERDAEDIIRGHGELILVADDEQVITQLLSEMLQEAGFRTVTANNGADALAKSIEHGANLKAVITDVQMPHMDGLKFARTLRKLNPDIPIVAISGRIEAHAEQELKKLGLKPTLHKPFSEKQLFAVLKQSLRASTLLTPEISAPVLPRNTPVYRPQLEPVMI